MKLKPALKFIKDNATSIEPRHDKTNKMAVRPAKTQISLGMIRVFTVRMKKARFLSYMYQFSAQRRLWSDWADAQADLSLRWTHSHFIGFVTSRFNSITEGSFFCPVLTEKKKKKKKKLGQQLNNLIYIAYKQNVTFRDENRTE